ncbi:MAG TPA: PAS domain-containing protein [Myxococcales bacterium]|jgi:PAS domain S-box-containing protein
MSPSPDHPQSLAAERDLLRSVFDSAASAILALDLGGRVVDCNPAAWKALGFGSRAELVGRQAASFAVSPLAVEAQLLAVISERIARKFECVLKVGEKPARVIELSVAPRRDPLGQLIGLVAVATDVAERKRTTEALRLVNDLALEFAAAPAAVEPFSMIAEKVRSALDARAMSISSYCPETHELTVRHVSIAGGVLPTVQRILGRTFVGMQLKVEPDMEKRMIAEVVSETEDLSFLSFGALSNQIIETLGRMVGIGDVHGLSLKHGGILYGSALLVMPPCEFPPSRELLHLLANLSAVTLRRPYTGPS